MPPEGYRCWSAATLSALSERNEKAEICRDKDGHPELRDTESAPLAEPIEALFEREVAG